MEKKISAKSSQVDYGKDLAPYNYVKEIVPYAVNRKLFKLEDVGRLGTSATHLGMGKIHAKTSTGKFIVEFFNKATIHGLNHIVAPRRHFVERILTILFLGVALTCSVVSSLYSWEQYQTNPTSMVVDIDYRNFNVTKPAVTVCLFEPISKDKFPEVFKKHGVKDTQEARDFFIFISKPEYSTMNQTPLYNDTSPDKWLEILRDLYLDFQIDLCQNWGCENPDVTNAVVVTEKGICTGVSGTPGSYHNYSSLEYWLSDSWTVFPQTMLPAYTYIYRDERTSYQHIPGPYEIVVHHPYELPRFDYSWYKIRIVGTEDLAIDIRQQESSDEVRKLSQKLRPCNFPEHGDLKMWPVYTRNMCILECRYNLIKSKCGCYPYFARPMPGIPICNATQLHCIGNISKLVSSLKSRGSSLCSCPNNCDTANYAVISLVHVDLTMLRDNLDSGWYTRTVNIDLQFPFYKLRHEIFFGFNEFLVSVGGAAGLFLGASIISFVEIIYYITLRLFWYISNKGKQRME